MVAGQVISSCSSAPRVTTGRAPTCRCSAGRKRRSSRSSRRRTHAEAVTSPFAAIATSRTRSRCASSSSPGSCTAAEPPKQRRPGQLGGPAGGGQGEWDFGPIGRGVEVCEGTIRLGGSSPPHLGRTAAGCRSSNNGPIESEMTVRNRQLSVEVRPSFGTPLSFGAEAARRAPRRSVRSGTAVGVLTTPTSFITILAIRYRGRRLVGMHGDGRGRPGRCRPLAGFVRKRRSVPDAAHGSAAKEIRS